MNKDNVNPGLINHGLLTRGELPKNTGNLTLKWYPLCSFRVYTVSPIIGTPPPARWGMLTITDQFLQWYETNLPAGIHILHVVYCSKQIFVDHIRYYMCHGHDMGCFIHYGDGHESINRDLYIHKKDSQYGMDDHKPYIPCVDHGTYIR